MKYVRRGGTRYVRELKSVFAGLLGRLQISLRSNESTKGTRGLRLMSVLFQFCTLGKAVLNIFLPWRDMVTPINRIPPEILVLIPDFWDEGGRDQDVIALTHVCRVWRELFISQASLWTRINWSDGDKPLVYLERSKTSPIDLSLNRVRPYCCDDNLSELIANVVGRLRSLFIGVRSSSLDDIISDLSRPAPFLEDLSIQYVYSGTPTFCPRLPPTLFDGDFSSLRRLRLRSIKTKLPWRNMGNLTSFSLAHIPADETSVGQLLDVFEGAPHLREVDLRAAALTPGTQNGRFISLECLKTMRIINCGPASVLLDHLLIPVGAHLVTEAALRSSLLENLLPTSLDNLENFPNYTTIRLSDAKVDPYIEFSGPNGLVGMTPTYSGVDETSLMLESLAQFDTSKIEQLTIDQGKPRSSDPFYRALLPMNDLRTLTLDQCMREHFFTYALHPNMGSQEVMVCPQLEELVVVFHRWGATRDVKDIIKMAAARASKGKKLRTVRIVDCALPLDPEDVLELRKHVLRLEHASQAGENDDD